MIQFKRIGLAAIAAIALLMMPLAASAATQSAAPMTLPLSGGALSITPVTALTFGPAAVTAGTLATTLHPANYSDQTASGNGWNATLAVQQFHVVPTWVTGTGSTALDPSTNNSPISGVQMLYSGTASASQYVIHVTTASPAVSSSVAVSWSGEETGTASATKGGGFAVGTKGLYIAFATGVAYSTTDTYSVKVGNLATSALNLNQPTTSITTVSGGTAPIATNSTATVPAGTTSTFGTAIPFASAAVNTGMGTYAITPGATLTWTPTATYATSYVSAAQYTITAGP